MSKIVSVKVRDLQQGDEVLVPALDDDLKVIYVPKTVHGIKSFGTGRYGITFEGEDRKIYSGTAEFGREVK